MSGETVLAPETEEVVVAEETTTEEETVEPDASEEDLGGYTQADVDELEAMFAEEEGTTEVPEDDSSDANTEESQEEVSIDGTAAKEDSVTAPQAQTVEDVRKELEAERQRFKSLNGRLEKQGREVLELRESNSYFNSINNALATNPELGNIISDAMAGKIQANQTAQRDEYVDFSDPVNFNKAVQAQVQAVLTQTQQRNTEVAKATKEKQIIQNFQIRRDNGVQNLMDSGITREAIDAEGNKFINDFFTDFATLAHNHANLPTLLQKAREDGKREGLGMLSAAGKAPKKLSGVKNSVKTRVDGNDANLTLDQLSKKMDGVDMGSKEWQNLEAIWTSKLEK